MGQNQAPDETASTECWPNSTTRSWICCVSGGWPAERSMGLVAGVVMVGVVVVAVVRVSSSLRRGFE
jgi:hypothetical protein